MTTAAPTPPRRLLVTGSREWKDSPLMWGALHDARMELGDDTVLVHGLARGADRMAAWIWRTNWNLRVEGHPANWQRYGKRAGYVRNAEMVAVGADLCLAFILDGSRGATMCAELAERAGIPVRRFEASS